MKLVLFDVEGVLLNAGGDTAAMTEPLKGIKEYLLSLQKEGHVLGVLTAQTAASTGERITKSGLEESFKFGVFGDGNRVTADMLKSALREASAHSVVSFGKRDVFWVVSSVKNARIAKELGVRAIAVASGGENVEQLSKAEPEFMFPDFHATRQLVSAIEPHVY